MNNSILVTGFDPFDGKDTNLSSIVALALNGREVNSHTILGVKLPVDRSLASEQTFDLMRTYNPKVVIGLGLGLPGKPILIETVAKNYENYTIPDNVGNQPKDQLIKKNGHVRLNCTLPVHSIVETLSASGYRTQLSTNAGSYICNNYFYQLMDFIQNEKPDTIAGFIHIPPIAQDTDTENSTSFTMDGMIDAIFKICLLTSNVDATSA